MFIGVISANPLLSVVLLDAFVVPVLTKTNSTPGTLVIVPLLFEYLYNWILYEPFLSLFGTWIKIISSVWRLIVKFTLVPSSNSTLDNVPVVPFCTVIWLLSVADTLTLDTVYFSPLSTLLTTTVIGFLNLTYPFPILVSLITYVSGSKLSAVIWHDSISFAIPVKEFVSTSAEPFIENPAWVVVIVLPLPSTFLTFKLYSPPFSMFGTLNVIRFPLKLAVIVTFLLVFFKPTSFWTEVVLNSVSFNAIPVTT